MATCKVILAKLCAEAPSNPVRNCIRLYDRELTFESQLKKIASTPVGTIQDALAYLKTPNLRPFTDYTKEGLLSQIIYRIQSLLPDTCRICNNIYTTEIDDPSILPCAICRQEFHHTCLATKLQIDLKESTPEEISQVINHYKIPGCTYLCPGCIEDFLPTEEQFIKKSVLKRAQQSQEPVQHTPVEDDNTERNEAATDTMPAPTDPPVQIVVFQPEEIPPIATAETEPDIQIVELPSDEFPPTLTDQANLPAAEQNHPQEVQPPNRVNNHIQTTPSSTPTTEHAQYLPSDPRSFPDICRNFLTCSCKRGSHCTYDHPPTCHNFLDHGIKGPHGCDGKSCLELHPPVCKNSLKHMRCMDDKCNMWHIKGTARGKKRRADQKVEKPSKTEPNPNSIDSSPSQHATGETIIQTVQKSFLDEVHLLKRELLEVLDTRFATLKSEMESTNAPHQENHLEDVPQYQPAPLQPVQIQNQQQEVHPLQNQEHSMLPIPNNQSQQPQMPYLPQFYYQQLPAQPRQFPTSQPQAPLFYPAPTQSIYQGLPYQLCQIPQQSLQQNQWPQPQLQHPLMQPHPLAFQQQMTQHPLMPNLYSHPQLQMQTQQCL